ncbi:MAG TPA: esterase family protein [Lapidilactobacillus dextrinicus]|uniref:Esterase family protein n=1 Tax=Lapidilactobacillus dextrinicus TaxID=51664 RepID=A0A921B3D5_9LACO|nr:esterase family protein [Lapidilactobacillus dextrinicus]
MAFLTLSRSSKIFETQTKVQVIIPDQLTEGRKLPVLWLLHGLGDNGSCWQRKTNLEQLASKYQLCIVMPDGGRSFYTNMAYGGRYWDYLTQELIPQMRAYLPISTEAATNYIAGNSMGGYGALKLALKKTDWFSAVAAISPVVDLSVVPSIMPDYQAVFGKTGITKPEYQLQTMTQNADLQSLRQLRWYHAIGDQDFMKHPNDMFNDYLVDQLGLTVAYNKGPGDHDWDYWNEQIRMVLNWLMVNENEVVK